MVLRFAAAASVAASILSGCSLARAAEPALPPFYQSVVAMKADGKLGQVIAREPSPALSCPASRTTS